MRLGILVFVPVANFSHRCCRFRISATFLFVPSPLQISKSYSPKFQGHILSVFRLDNLSSLNTLPQICLSKISILSKTSMLLPTLLLPVLLLPRTLL